MEDFSKGFSVRDIHFTWGATFSDVCISTRDIEELKPYGGRPNKRFRCNSILGMPALVCEVAGPSCNRPVMQVTYELRKGQPNIIDNRDYWVSIISNIIGNPYKESERKNTNIFNAASEVIYNIKWRIGEVIINLSVYGGERNIDAGLSSASLGIDWKDEILAAKPYIEKYDTQQALLEEIAKGFSNYKLYKIGKQKPYYRADYEFPDPHMALKNDILRKSQKVLYNNTLLETPEEIGVKLDDFSVALWRGNKGPYWGLSTHWDSIFFTGTEEFQIDFIKVLPAKGPGGTYLRINGLNIDDYHDSSSIKALVADLENIVGLKIDHKVSSDW